MHSKRKKIGIIGVGKRFVNVYYDILSKLDYELVIWNRTAEKAISFSEGKEPCSCESSLSDLIKNENIDMFLSFLPSAVSYEVLGSFDFKVPLLIETPVEDQRWINKKNVGVLEQWIHLPIEKFKEVIYETGFIDRPYWVFNDGRSFDYHAIAQLRSYTGKAHPKLLSGNLQNVPQAQHKNKEGAPSETSDFWTHGQIELNNGALVTHSFSYNCKMTLLKPFQLLRSYSSNGCITSGRCKSMDDDYECLEVRYIGDDGNVVIEKPIVKHTGKTVASISLKKAKVGWKNQLSHLELDDQQIAIATLLQEALNGKYYLALESYIDNYCILGVKHAYTQKSILRTN